MKRTTITGLCGVCIAIGAALGYWFRPSVEPFTGGSGAQVAGTGEQLSAQPADSASASTLVPPPAVEGESSAPPTASLLADTMARHLNQAIEKQDNARNATYEPALYQLGLTQAQVEQTLTNLHRMDRLARQAGDPLTELVIARVAHDEAMKEMLGPENYAKYREFEELQKFQLQVDAIAKSANGDSVAFDPIHSEPLRDLLYKHSLLDGEKWSGPYDPLPRPVSGADLVLPFLEEKKGVVNAGLSSFLADEVVLETLPDEVIALTRGYFERRLSSYDDIIRTTLMDPKQRRIEKMERFQAKLEELRRQGKIRTGRSALSAPY